MNIKYVGPLVIFFLFNMQTLAKVADQQKEICSAAELAITPMPKSCMDLPMLRLNTTTEPPYTNPEHNGFLDTIVAEMFRRAGYRFKSVVLPAERGLVSANEGEIDGDMVRIAGLDKQYPNLIRIPEKVLDWEFCAFVKKNSKLTKSNYKEFRKYKTGIIRGWKIYEEKMAGSKKLVVVSNSGQLLNMLDIGNIDVALYSRSNGQHMIKALDLKDIKILEPPLDKQQMYIYLNKRHAQVVPKLAQALRDIKAEGLYDKVYRKTVSGATNTKL